MTLDEAKDILTSDGIYISPLDNGLFKNADYIGWTEGNETVTLDGYFTIPVLEAIVVYIKSFTP